MAVVELHDTEESVLGLVIADTPNTCKGVAVVGLVAVNAGEGVTVEDERFAEVVLEVPPLGVPMLHPTIPTVSTANKMTIMRRFNTCLLLQECN